MIQFIKDFFNKKKLEKLMSRDFYELQQVGIRNHNYLIENLLKHDNLEEILKNPDKIKIDIQKRLGKLSHSYRDQRFDDIYYPYTEYSKNVRNMEAGQYLRVLYMINALENQDFCNEIGKLVLDDLNDPYSEHGGIIVFNNQGLKCKHYDSVYAKAKQVRHNNDYKLPDEANSIPFLFQYHIHASQEDCSDVAGPSQGNYNILPGDMAACHIDITLESESHNILFTKLQGNNFNVDYYGGIDHFKDVKIDVLDLGNYSFQP